MEDNSHWKI